MGGTARLRQPRADRHRHRCRGERREGHRGTGPTPVPGARSQHGLPGRLRSNGGPGTPRDRGRERLVRVSLAATGRWLDGLAPHRRPVRAGPGPRRGGRSPGTAADRVRRDDVRAMRGGAAGHASRIRATVRAARKPSMRVGERGRNAGHSSFRDSPVAVSLDADIRTAISRPGRAATRRSEVARAGSKGRGRARDRVFVDCDLTGFAFCEVARAGSKGSRSSAATGCSSTATSPGSVWGPCQRAQGPCGPRAGAGRRPRRSAGFRAGAGGAR